MSISICTCMYVMSVCLCVCQSPVLRLRKMEKRRLMTTLSLWNQKMIICPVLYVGHFLSPTWSCVMEFCFHTVYHFQGQSCESQEFIVCMHYAGNVSPYSVQMFGSLGSQPAGDLLANTALGCCYFCEACGFLFSQRTSPPTGQYQIVLHDNRGRHMCENNLPRMFTC